MDISNVAMRELYSSGLSQGQISDLCEYGNKNSFSLKVLNFFSRPSNFTFLNVTQHGVFQFVTMDIFGWFLFSSEFFLSNIDTLIVQLIYIYIYIYIYICVCVCVCVWRTNSNEGNVTRR